MQDNTDFENLENITFKPITGGLGFHHEINENKEELARAKRINSKNDNMKKYALENYIKEDKLIVDMGELSPFYQDKIETFEVKSIKISKQNELNQEECHFLDAPSFKRFLAWSIDTTIVTFGYMTTIYIAATAADIKLMSVIDVELFYNTSPLLIFYYLFYFTVMDKSRLSTLGKRILKIQLEQKGLTINKTFIRSIITIVSFLTLGLGSYLLLQDKLTDTRVIKS